MRVCLDELPYGEAIRGFRGWNRVMSHDARACSKFIYGVTFDDSQHRSPMRGTLLSVGFSASTFVWTADLLHRLAPSKDWHFERGDPRRRSARALMRDALIAMPVDTSSGSSRPSIRRRSSAGIHGFLAASLLTAAFVLPHSRLMPLGSGVALAAAIRWIWLRLSTSHRH